MPLTPRCARQGYPDEAVKSALRPVLDLVRELLRLVVVRHVVVRQAQSLDFDATALKPRRQQAVGSTAVLEELPVVVLRRHEVDLASDAHGLMSEMFIAGHAPSFVRQTNRQVEQVPFVAQSHSVLSNSDARLAAEVHVMAVLLQLAD